MADTSPGKVQALRAIFAQNDPVLALLPPPASKMMAKPWKRSMTSLHEDQLESGVLSGTEYQESTLYHQNTILKAMQKQQEGSQNENDADKVRTCQNPLTLRIPQKPVIGPKPTFAKQQSCNQSTNLLNVPSATMTSPSSGDVKVSKIVPPKPKRNCYSKKLEETALSKCIESLVNQHAYTNGHVTNDQITVYNIDRISENGSSRMTSVNDSDVISSNKNNSVNLKLANDAKAMSIINSDNYICKSPRKFVRNKLPPQDKLGQAPLKPSKPVHLKLPSIKSLYNPCEKFTSSVSESSSWSKPNMTSQCGPNTHAQARHVTTVCPPRPTTAPPVPPPPVPSMISSTFDHASPSLSRDTQKPSKSLVEEIEELYEDTLLGRNHGRTSFLIAPCTSREEQEDEELYDDAGDNELDEEPPPPCPPKPRNPPPPPPSIYLDPIGNPISEELYQDAIEASDEEFYEEMPNDLPEEDHYINNRKELQKLRREKEKQLRKENKEKEKREKEMEKVKKKFGILGNEIPIDAGVVKLDSRGGRCDLQVCRGEKVYILRIEGNPAGKWLVRNKKGKFGYVELTNIEVDPNSVKSVMIERRTSVISSSNSEELYCEAYSEQEAIYETTY